MDFPNKKEQQLKLSLFLSRNFKLLTMSWLMLIFVLGILIVIIPKYISIVSGETENKNKLWEELEKNKKELKESNEILAVFNQISPSDLEKVDILLPSKNVNEELFPKIKEIVTRNGLILNSTSIEADKQKTTSVVNLGGDEEPTQPDSLNKVGKIKIRLNISGADYYSMVSLLDSFEKNLRVMDVQNISFDPSGGSLSLDLNTYFLKEE